MKKSNEFMNFKTFFVKWLSNQTNEFSDNLENFDRACKCIFYMNKLPFDSFDRIFALYLINQHYDIIESFDIEKATSKSGEEYTEKFFNEKIKQNQEILDEWNSNSIRAYDNYEREGITDTVAFGNMLYVAKNGPEAVLKDSYYKNGWFGAS